MRVMELCNFTWKLLVSPVWASSVHCSAGDFDDLRSELAVIWRFIYVGRLVIYLRHSILHEAPAAGWQQDIEGRGEMDSYYNYSW